MGGSLVNKLILGGRLVNCRYIYIICLKGERKEVPSMLVPSRQSVFNNSKYKYKIAANPIPKPYVSNPIRSLPSLSV
jgi:hypothetical protein